MKKITFLLLAGVVLFGNTFAMEGMKKNKEGQEQKAAVNFIDWNAHYRIGHHMICEGQGYDFEYITDEYGCLGGEVVVNKKDISAEELNNWLTKFAKIKPIRSLNLYQCKGIDFSKINWKLLKDLREIILIGTDITFLVLMGILSVYYTFSKDYSIKYEYEDMRIFFPESSKEGISEEQIQKINCMGGINSNKAKCRSYRPSDKLEWLKGQKNYEGCGYVDWPSTRKTDY